MSIRGLKEELPCGEIRMTRDPKGRLTGALFVLDGRAYGWRLEVDPSAKRGTFISPDRMGEYRWRDGSVELHASWHDGPAVIASVGYDDWVESCIADIRDTGYVHVARKATRALDEGKLDEADRLFRAFEAYASARPGAYNQAALGRILTTAALVKAARNDANADDTVASALAAAFAVEEPEQKGSAALGRRLKRILGGRHAEVVGRAAQASLAALEASWASLDEASRWSRLVSLRERVEMVAGAEGLSALAEAAAARETADRNLARFARELALREGPTDRFEQLNPHLVEQEGASIADLNNQANAVMNQGRYDEADGILAAVAARLVPVGSDRQALIDEYFYQGNLAELRWRQERYQEGVAPAERAYQLERRLADMHARENPHSLERVFDRSAMFSNATWSIISIYTRLGRIDDAERLFEGELLDLPRLTARREANAEAIENAFNAGMCIYTENKTPASMARGRRLFALMVERIPVPSSPILTWCYACAYGYYDDPDRAKEFLERAIAMGVSRAELRNDPDFDPVRDRPWFTALLG